MEPARWFFRNHEHQPTTEVAIHRSFAKDLYIVLAGDDMETQTATFQVHVNPLVDWIWFGFGIMAFGTVIALLPESAFAFAAAKVPAGAATTGLLLFFLLAPAAPARAQQHTDAVAGPVPPRTALEKKMRGELVCVCGDCPHYSLTDCLCPVADKERAQLAELIKQDKNESQMKAWFVATYGSEEPLGAPIDRGFNRLAWLFPYMLGGAGALLALGVAVRWSHRERPAPAPAASAAGVDPPCRNNSTMSSATSTKSRSSGAAAAAAPAPSADTGFRPWHFFVLASLLAATAAVMLAAHPSPANLVLTSVTIGAAGLAGYAFYRTLAPLALDEERQARRVARRAHPRGTRAREDARLRSIKELEFDRAMGKVSDQDFQEMAARLRARAIALMKQLDDSGAGYRQLIEQELRARLGRAGAPTAAAAAPETAPAPETGMAARATAVEDAPEPAAYCPAVARRSTRTRASANGAAGVWPIPERRRTKRHVNISSDPTVPRDGRPRGGPRGPRRRRGARGPDARARAGHGPARRHGDARPVPDVGGAAPVGRHAGRHGLGAGRPRDDDQHAQRPARGAARRRQGAEPEDRRDGPCGVRRPDARDALPGRHHRRRPAHRVADLRGAVLGRREAGARRRPMRPSRRARPRTRSSRPGRRSRASSC